jgi:hypothetical protein
MSILRLVVTFLGSLFKSQRQLVLENLAGFSQQSCRLCGGGGFLPERRSTCQRPGIGFSMCSSCSATTAGKLYTSTRPGTPPLSGRRNS